MNLVFTCSYQMNPANYREALVELQADESEGADILLVSFAFDVLQNSWMHTTHSVLKLFYLHIRLNQVCLIWIL